MAAVSISLDNDDITATVTSTGSCGSIAYITYKLYQNGGLYTSNNTTATSYAFNNVPGGNDYYVIIDIYITGPTFCETATSNTVTVDYCLPSDATNVSMFKLAKFYNVNTTNIALSGPNDPSTGGSPWSIFGSSNLPGTGTISRTRPNAISELRGDCGGGQTWFFYPVYLFGNTDLTTACSLGSNPANRSLYYVNFANFVNATSIWTNSTLTTKLTSSAGYYTDGIDYIYIDSSGDVTSSGDCPT